jgi:signal transduction histidine kinase
MIWLCSAAAGILLFIVSVPLTFDRGEPDAGYMSFQIYSGIAALVLLAVSLRCGRQFATLATVMIGATSVPGFAAALVTTVRASRSGPVSVAVRAGLLLFVGGSVSLLLDPAGWSPAMAAATAVLAVVMVVVGRILASRDRQRREIAELRRESVRTTERMRIARDIHDSLSHRLSLIAIHSGVLEYRDDLTPAQTKDAVSTVRTQAEAASADLGEIIGTLRIPHDSDRTPKNPEEVLVAAAKSGQSVDLPDGFPSQESLEQGFTTAGMTTVDAMLKECLNNASRYAPGTTTTVVAGTTDETLRITVSGPRGSSRPGAGSTGYGLIGLRERAELIGGTLGVDDGLNRFAVTLTVPWQGGRR